MRFSVIIPVYQAEKTIARCLDSLMSEQFQDYELLVINDGSTDKSAEICRKYAQDNAIIRYYEKENGGVSSARNYGLDRAQGEYVLFVDSDDYVADNYFTSINHALSDHSAELLLFGFYNTQTNNIAHNYDDFSEVESSRIAERIAGLMVGNRFNSLWLKCFKNDIIQKNQIRFDETVAIAEDFLFIFSYVLHISSVKAIPLSLYYVDESNVLSLSRNIREDLDQQLLHICLSAYDMLEATDVSSQIRTQYSKALAWMFYRSVYSSSKELHKYLLSYGGRQKRLFAICSKYANQKVLPQGWKCWLLALPVLLRLTPAIDVITWKLTH